MSWKFFQYTDPGAPTLTGQAGSLITLLDAVLVTGLGWSKAFTGTNKAAYLSAAPTPRYFRVLDDGTPALGAKEATFCGYESMSDVDTGTGGFPTAAQAANGLQIPKSNTLDATARPWLAVGDGRTFILFTKPLSTWLGVYIGDIESCKLTPDAYSAMAIGGAAGTAVTASASNVLIDRTLWAQSYEAALAAFTPTAGHYLCRHHDGTGTALNVMKTSMTQMCADEVNGVGFGFINTKFNPADGATILSRLIIGYELALRGWLRGLTFVCHNFDQYEELEPITGSGSMAGHSYVVVPTCNSLSTLYVGLIALETSDTVT